jgi:BolA protein
MSEDRSSMIRERLTRALDPVELEIVDESAKHAGHAGAASGGGHFIVHIVANAFEGRNPVQRHRMVYDAMDDMMQSEIHALSIHAKTPQEI